MDDAEYRKLYELEYLTCAGQIQSAAFDDPKIIEPLAKDAARIGADLLTGRSSDEEYCSEFLRWLEKAREEVAKIPPQKVAKWNAIQAEHLKDDKSLRAWGEAYRAYSPLEFFLEYGASNMLHDKIYRQAPRLKKSPVFARMVSQIIADERWKLGRRRCLYEIAYKISVKVPTLTIDYERFTNDVYYVGAACCLLLRRKDGRFVDSAAKSLERQPKHHCYVYTQRYVERYKTSE